MSVKIVVLGGGSAGIGAAIAAGRLGGAEVTLIERSGMAGGTWTVGLQNHVTCMHDHQKVVVRGIALELMKRLAANDEGEDPEEKIKIDPRCWWNSFDPEGLKYQLDQMLLEAGVSIRYHSFGVGAKVESGKITGIEVESKSGREFFAADVIIDCSGDADAAWWAGARTVKGREDGLMQPVTTAFMLANVDWERAAAFAKTNPEALPQAEKQARINGELTDYPISLYLGCPTHIPGITYHNMTRVLNIDATNAADLTRAEIEGRRQARQAAYFFRKHIVGFERAQLVATGQIGLRETRRLCGVYTMTREDIMQSRKFHDAVACHANYIDMHNPEGKGGEADSGDFFHPPEGDYYQIPYRALVPETINGLLVAGRCISADRAALGSVRTTACCVALGQAAGIAGVLAVQNALEVRDLPYELLRQEMLKQDVYLG